MAFPVFLDTCVLYPGTLCDLILRIAEMGAFRPHWSQDVLDELLRNLAKLESVGEEGARRRVGAMTTAFPEASITGHERLTPGMGCDPKDRHVLAAAVHSDCQLIVTFNLRDFPVASLAPHHMDVVSPDDFLLDQLDLYPRAVVKALRQQSSDSRRPQLTPVALMAAIQRSGCPKFAAEVLRKVDFSTWQSADRD